MVAKRLPTQLRQHTLLYTDAALLLRADEKTLCTILLTIHVCTHNVLNVGMVPSCMMAGCWQCNASCDMTFITHAPTAGDTNYTLICRPTLGADNTQEAPRCFHCTFSVADPVR